MPQTPDIPPDTHQTKEAIRRHLAQAKISRLTGAYDSAIESYLRALAGMPDEVTVHKELREVSLQRKIARGKDMGVLGKLKCRTNTNDDKTNMLNAERLLAYEPLNTGYMVVFLQCAHRAGFEKAAAWMESLLHLAVGAGRK